MSMFFDIADWGLAVPITGTPIQPGQMYLVKIDDVRFKVRAVKPAVIKGWWLCETETGDRVMVPAEHVINEDDPGRGPAPLAAQTIS